MKTVILVLVCVVLVGFAPKPEQESAIDPAEPCMPDKAACIVSVDGVSLIRAPTFWLLDLRGHSTFDVSAMIDAAKQCDGSKGCGSPMSKQKVEVLVGELAQATVELLQIAGESVAAYRVVQGTVVQFWPGAKLEEILSQLSPVPLPGCPGCGPCILAQCELPVRPPVRDFYVVPGTAVWAVRTTAIPPEAASETRCVPRTEGQLSADCVHDRQYPACS